MIAWFQGWMIARLNDYMMTWLYDEYTQYRLSQKWLPHPSTPWLHEYTLAWWIVEYHMNLPHDARGVGDPQCHHLRLICVVHLLCTTAWWIYIIYYHKNLPHDAGRVGDPQRHHLWLLCPVHLLLPHDEFTLFNITWICPMMQGESWSSMPISTTPLPGPSSTTP